MIRRPCKCGATPTIEESVSFPIHIIQVQCKCGLKGAALMYTKPQDRERMRQAAADGWNLA